LLLTEKEIEVLKLRRAGLTQVDVASRLNVSQAAVSSFEKNAFRKIEDSKEVIKFANSMKLKVMLK
jgi:HTH-type transcriptional regulator, fmd operon transcriptional regulator